MKNLQNHDGFTLLEVLIALLVLTIGILGIANLQMLAIQQNKTAFERTRANAVALAVLEELKRLPFDDANLSDAGGNGNLDAGKAPSGGTPTPGNAEHAFNPALIAGLSNSYTLDGNEIIDGSGTRYQIFWNVDRFTVAIGTENLTPFCTIRLFAYWDTPLGQRHMEVTTVKYNNVEL